MHFSLKMGVLVFVQIKIIHGIGIQFFDIDVPEIAYMEFLNDFKYQRYMDTEQKTCNTAVRVIEGLLRTFKTDLATLMQNTEKHIKLMLLCVDALAPKACIQYFATFPVEVVDTEMKQFTQCMELALFKQHHMNNTFSKTYKKFQSRSFAAMKKMKSCHSLFPDMKDGQKWKACSKAVFNTYFTQTAPIAQPQLKSSCMQNFVRNVINCITNSVTNIQVKIEEYLSAVTKCAKLDPEGRDCVETEDLGFIIEPSFKIQIKGAQDEFTIMNERFENTVEKLHPMLTEFFQRGFFQHHDLVIDEVHENVSKLIEPYLKSLQQTKILHPSERICGELSELVLIDINEGVLEGLRGCYENSIKATDRSLKEVLKEFERLAKILTTLGNVAILDCIDSGFVFGFNTVTKCFDLKVRELEVFFKLPFDALKERMEKISQNLPDFKKPYTLPCVEQEITKIQLSVDKVLFNYKKCLYVKAETGNFVTTSVRNSPQGTISSLNNHI